MVALVWPAAEKVSLVDGNDHKFRVVADGNVLGRSSTLRLSNLHRALNEPQTSEQ